MKRILFALMFVLMLEMVVGADCVGITDNKFTLSSGNCDLKSGNDVIAVVYAGNDGGEFTWENSELTFADEDLTFDLNKEILKINEYVFVGLDEFDSVGYGTDGLELRVNSEGGGLASKIITVNFEELGKVTISFGEKTDSFIYLKENSVTIKNKFDNQDFNVKLGDENEFDFVLNVNDKLVVKKNGESYEGIIVLGADTEKGSSPVPIKICGKQQYSYGVVGSPTEQKSIAGPQLSSNTYFKFNLLIDEDKDSEVKCSDFVCNYGGYKSSMGGITLWCGEEYPKFEIVNTYDVNDLKYENEKWTGDLDGEVKLYAFDDKVPIVLNPVPLFRSGFESYDVGSNMLRAGVFYVGGSKWYLVSSDSNEVRLIKEEFSVFFEEKNYLNGKGLDTNKDLGFMKISLGEGEVKLVKEGRRMSLMGSESDYNLLFLGDGSNAVLGYLVCCEVSDKEVGANNGVSEYPRSYGCKEKQKRSILILGESQAFEAEGVIPKVMEYEKDNSFCQDLIAPRQGEVVNGDVKSSINIAPKSEEKKGVVNSCNEKYPGWGCDCPMASYSRVFAGQGLGKLWTSGDCDSYSGGCERLLCKGGRDEHYYCCSEDAKSRGGSVDIDKVKGEDITEGCVDVGVFICNSILINSFSKDVFVCKTDDKGLLNAEFAGSCLENEYCNPNLCDGVKYDIYDDGVIEDYSNCCAPVEVVEEKICDENSKVFVGKEEMSNTLISMNSQGTSACIAVLRLVVDGRYYMASCEEGRWNVISECGYLSFGRGIFDREKMADYCSFNDDVATCVITNACEVEEYSELPVYKCSEDGSSVMVCNCLNNRESCELSSGCTGNKPVCKKKGYWDGADLCETVDVGEVYTQNYEFVCCYTSLRYEWRTTKDCVSPISRDECEDNKVNIGSPEDYFGNVYDCYTASYGVLGSYICRVYSTDYDDVTPMKKAPEQGKSIFDWIFKAEITKKLL